MNACLPYRADHYYCFDEMVQQLKAWAEAYPNLFKLEYIGKSYEGRLIPVAIVTDYMVRAASEKPAYYIDANHHAGEVTGSAVALYTINYLLTNYGQEQRATRLLQEFTFYIIPRIAVDGSELYLTTPYMLRSSVRPYSPQQLEGLIMEDIDGDGHILNMRVKNPYGKYKASAQDSRLMVPRQPDDWEGEFYDVYVEGLIENYDGCTVKPRRSRWGLDFNRNYPMNWKPESYQHGAGDYPFSEPETRAVGDFILNHKNIAGCMSYHTHGGMILRPRCKDYDRTIVKEDKKIFDDMAGIGKRLTGYPQWSVFEGLTANKTHPSAGCFMEFTYDYLGIITFATELWDKYGRAGLEKKYFFDMTPKEQEEEELALLRWNDAQFDGKLFINWYEAEHPQLGKVEIGGWLPKFGRQNPPTSLLEEECHKNMLFTFSHAQAMPRLEIMKLEAAEIGEGVYKITLDVANAGYMPTSGSKQAEINQVATKIKTYIEGKLQVCVDKNERELGYMPGFSKRRVEWLIQATSGTKITVYVDGQRAGKIQRCVTV